ncbi:MAG: hypothetical protein B6D64_08410 [Bacteroidetes bacterium 4484_276]|nr:MAG: hypothetical protein B6D64_08410 [Bacteroidetes bacterium 4484_276]
MDAKIRKSINRDSRIANLQCIGDNASPAFADLIDETDEQKIDTIRQNLLEYCKLDTLAMVEILRVLGK